MSGSNWCFLICIQISQEAWYSHLFKNFPQFVVIHTVKGFSIVSEGQADFFSWNFLAVSVFQWMLELWSLIPLPFLNPTWTCASACPFRFILVHWFLKCRYSLLPSPVWPLLFTLIHGPNIEVSMQKRQTLLPTPVTSTAGHCFCFGSASTFSLEQFLQSFPVVYWAPTNLGSSSFSVPQEDLGHTWRLPGVLQPEPPSLRQATDGPCLHRRCWNTQRQVWLSLCGILGPGVYTVFFEPSKHLWWAWVWF